MRDHTQTYGLGGHVLQTCGTGVPPVAPPASRRREIATFIQSTHEGGDSGQATIPQFAAAGSVKAPARPCQAIELEHLDRVQ